MIRDIFTVIKFTIKDMVKRKSFIISTLIILIMIVVGFNVPNLIKKFNGDNTKNKLLIIDSKNVFEGTLDNIKQMNLGYEFEITNEDLQYEDVKSKIEDKEMKDQIKMMYVNSKENTVEDSFKNILDKTLTIFKQPKMKKEDALKTTSDIREKLKSLNEDKNKE